MSSILGVFGLPIGKKIIIQNAGDYQIKNTLYLF